MPPPVDLAKIETLETVRLIEHLERGRSPWWARWQGELHGIHHWQTDRLELRKISDLGGGEQAPIAGPSQQRPAHERSPPASEQQPPAKKLSGDKPYEGKGKGRA